MEAKPPYRSDIDGLRAIAVLLVVFYHYGVWPLTGGFVGVDVFFVVSGFVITQKIRREQYAGSFTLRRFYAGRVRRILPALATVITASLIAGAFLLMPTDYEALGHQAAHAALGLSNFYFVNNSGYFARASDLLPLLHTWSLGVEEQFYLAWPFLLLGLTSKAVSNRVVILVLVGIVGVSLAWSAFMVGENRQVAFYMLHTRAWELALGGLMTFVSALRRGHLFANTAGLSLIVASALLLNSADPFPGLAAVPVCLGTSFLVWRKENEDAISRALSGTAMVQIGRASYSLYLWHWPILVFYRHINFEQEPTPVVSAALMVLSLALAFTSLHFIENPFRSKEAWRKVSVPLPVAAALVLTLAGAGIVAASGLPQRLPPAALSVAAGATDVSVHRSQCHRPEALKETPVAGSCILGQADVRPTALIWGDSHAVELGDALSARLAKTGSSLLSVTYSSCPPAVGFERAGVPGCDEHNAAVLQYALSAPQIDTVFLVARFEGVLREDAFGFTADFKATVYSLTNSGKDVVIIGPVPTTSISVPLVASRMMMHNVASTLTIDLEAYQRANRAILALLDELAQAHRVHVVRVEPFFCDARRCRTTEAGHSLYFDNHHLSRFGAQWLINQAFPDIPSRH